MLTDTAIFNTWLPADWQDATLVGRIDAGTGPATICVVDGRVRDVSRVHPTVSQLLNAWDGSIPEGIELGALDRLSIAAAFAGGSRLRLLPPVDLHCIKASGVTFAASAIERVIEERARGEAARAEQIRSSLRERIRMDIGSVRPGSEAAQQLKAALIADGLWSQYLEVAIGADAEIFTKAPVLP